MISAWSSPSPMRDDERAVDLQRVHLELLQVAQRTVAGAEVVQADPHPDVAQPGEHPADLRGVGNRGGLGDFQPKGTCRKPRLAQGTGDHGDQRGVAERLGRQVDADGQPVAIVSCAPPGLGLPAGFRQHPIIDLGDDADVFRHLEERPGGQEAARGMLAIGSAPRSPPRAGRSARRWAGTTGGTPAARPRAAVRSPTAAAPRRQGAWRRRTRHSRHRRRPWRDASRGRHHAPPPRWTSGSDATDRHADAGTDEHVMPARRRWDAPPAAGCARRRARRRWAR